MVLIGDTRRDAEAFLVSSRFKGLAHVLMRQLNGQSLEEAMKAGYVTSEVWRWAANVLGQINWQGSNYNKATPDIGVLATSLRPMLIREAHTRDVSISFYDVAHDYFSGKRKIDMKDLRTLHQILNEVSARILTSLQVAHGSYAF